MAAASTHDKDLRGGIKQEGNVGAATVVGKAIAERAMAAGIKRVRFDRGPYKFHGRVAALAGAALPVFFGVLIGERPEILTWIGVAVALPAILLLTIERGDGKGAVMKSLRTGIIAGLGFGGFFILLSRTGDDSGIWPLVAARTASVPFLLILTKIRRMPLTLTRGSVKTTLGAGILDMVANVFYLLASRSGLLITAAVITALYPAPTVLLQRLVLKERLSVVRLAGLALALTGIALIGLG